MCVCGGGGGGGGGGGRGVCVCVCVCHNKPILGIYCGCMLSVAVPLVEFMYLIYLHACQARATVGDSGLYCCAFVTSFER